MTEINQLNDGLLVIDLVEHHVQEDFQSLNVGAGLFLRDFGDSLTHRRNFYFFTTLDLLAATEGSLLLLVLSYLSGSHS